MSKCVFGRIENPLGIGPRVVKLSFEVDQFPILWETVILISMVIKQVCSPTNNGRVFPGFHTLTSILANLINITWKLKVFWFVFLWWPMLHISLRVFYSCAILLWRILNRSLSSWIVLYLFIRMSIAVVVFWKKMTPKGSYTVGRYGDLIRVGIIFLEKVCICTGRLWGLFSHFSQYDSQLTSCCLWVKIQGFSSSNKSACLPPSSLPL